MVVLRRDRHREPTADSVLESLAREGWQVLRTLPEGRHAPICLLTGPGGAFAVEARTPPGIGRIANVPSAWLRQAALGPRAAGSWLGIEVAPLLVLRNAGLDSS